MRARRFGLLAQILVAPLLGALILIASSAYDYLVSQRSLQRIDRAEQARFPLLVRAEANLFLYARISDTLSAAMGANEASFFAEALNLREQVKSNLTVIAQIAPESAPEVQIMARDFDAYFVAAEALARQGIGRPGFDARQADEVMRLGASAHGSLNRFRDEYYRAFVQDLGQTRREIATALQVGIVMSLLAFSVIVLASVAFARRVLVNVKQVVHALRQLAGGGADLTRRLSTRAHDEIGDLVTHFNDFMDKLELDHVALVKARLEAVTERERAEAQKDFLEVQKQEVELQRNHAEQANKVISQLGYSGRQIAGSLDIDSVLHQIAAQVQALLEVQRFAVYLERADGGALECVFLMCDGVRLPPESMCDSEADQMVRRCMARIEPLLVGNAAPTPSADSDGPHWRSQLCVPMQVGGRVRGAIFVQHARADAYREVDLDTLVNLAAYAVIALENANVYRQLGRAMRQLQEAQQQIVFQEKMASLGTLTAGVAHEINNPVNFSHAGAQTLRSEMARFQEYLLALAGEEADPALLASFSQRFATINEMLDVIIEGTSRIRDLVRDLRTFSQLDKAQLKMVRIGEGLMSTINLVRTQNAEVANIVCDLAADPLLECWPAQLNQVFMNLIVNACQSIRAKRQADPDSAPGQLSIRSRQRGAWLDIEFEDNGCGMEPSVMGRVFEPFFTTKSVGEGTGLGLSISFGIIERHNGSIEVRSQPGLGSCFTIHLPLPQADNAVADL